MFGIGMPELIVIIIIAIIIFWVSPKIARKLGKGIGEFKKGLKEKPPEEEKESKDV